MDKHIPIPGSERSLHSSVRKVADTDLNEQVTITVVVRRNGGKDMPAEMHEPLVSGKLYERTEFASKISIHPDDLKIINEFADNYHLIVEEVRSSAGTVKLSGTVENLTKAFQVDLANYEHPEYAFRGREGHVNIPEQLSNIVQAVLGLDNRPQSKTRFRLLQERQIEPRTNQSSYTPLNVAELYNFPKNVDCSDQCIAIIELGGGYKTSDIEEYFSKLGLKPPTIVDVEVDGAKNTPTGDPNGPDGEVALDIEIAAAVAQGAKIAVYFAPNSDAGFLNAITTAIHDNENKPSIISISWGAPESSWTRQGMEAMNQAFRDAAALGVTICCASGDNGSSDGVEDGRAHVDFPASSPYVLGCGGTRLEQLGEEVRETVWNNSGNGATGGGISVIFTEPQWQKTIISSVDYMKNGRGVPDVAGNADPMTGYQILVNGQEYIFGGTSAVAPLYAGLFANINHELGTSIGYVNPIFYQYAGTDYGFRDVTEGNNDTIGNGSYQAVAGWDACTGLGSIDGQKLLNAFKNNIKSKMVM